MDLTPSLLKLLDNYLRRIFEKMNPSANVLSFNRPAEVGDADLVASALSGREDSFEELVRRYQRPIAAYVYRMVGDYEAALDLTQEIFIKIHVSLDRYEPAYKFSTWIYRISHNAAIDYMRRVATREQPLMGGLEGEPCEIVLASKAMSPQQETEREERRARIEAIVRRLPLPYKELVILRHSQDLSYDEIAEVTGLPLGTVKNRLFRAREMLRQQLVQQGITGI